MVEALLGAVFLDSGLDAARSVLLHLMREPLAELKQVVTDAQGNPKGQLQELIQARTTERAVYSIIAETGEDHSKQFHASVSWRNQVYGNGVGKTKKDAETEAARATLNNTLFQDALPPPCLCPHRVANNRAERSERLAELPASAQCSQTGLRYAQVVLIENHSGTALAAL